MDPRKINWKAERGQLEWASGSHRWGFGLKRMRSAKEIEGGYVKDPRDPGGEPDFGISKHSYAGASTPRTCPATVTRYRLQLVSSNPEYPRIVGLQEKADQVTVIGRMVSVYA